MITVVVEDVRYSGKYGGGIFSGRCSAGQQHRYVVGYDVMPRVPVKGEVWSILAEKENHPKYGLQYIAKKAVLQCPSGRLIIKTIANSHLFPGIGEKTAEKLFRRYGEKLYDMLDACNPEVFVKPLKSDSLARVLVNGWQELATEANVYRWLDRHGVPVWLARKIINLYGSEAIKKIEENPYRLQSLTSWEKVEAIRKSLNITEHDDRRLVAGVDHVVFKRLTSGQHDQIGKHTWTELSEFENLVTKTLDCKKPVAHKAIDLALEYNAIVKIGGGVQGIGPASMEKYIADSLRTMSDGLYQSEQRSIRVDPDQAFMDLFYRDYHSTDNICLNNEQKAAVRMAVSRPASIICGGAGVGKTTVLKAICVANERLGGQIYMIALSGRAARRMQEATGRDAMTIASFVNKVDKGDIDLVDTEALIAIDEASMLDLPTMYRLLRRLEPGCRLLMIGDPGQLPPISFGVVFHTLVEQKALPMVELTKVHRQAASTGIPQISQAIREGQIPSFGANIEEENGVVFIDCAVEDISEKLLDLVENLGGSEAVRILSPVKRGEGGVLNINRRFHLRNSSDEIPSLHVFSQGEPVIWTENDYDLDLMNGTLGTITKVTKDGLQIEWDNGEKHITDLRRMDHAYAITVHKSQGSQFKRCIVPVFDSKLLDRTLLYTSVTRAQEQVILVGDRQAFEKAIISPPSTSVRETGLRFYL